MEEISSIQTAIEDIIIDNTYPAKEISAMMERFMDWAVKNCFTHFKNFTDGMQWAISEEVSDWDGEPNKWYSSKELFSYWYANIECKSAL